jgi:cobalt/nickel transport system ATP-binding protein
MEYARQYRRSIRFLSNYNNGVMELKTQISETAIYCHDVSFTYPNGTNAVSGINLTVKDGEKVGIIGPNGAGKSTFLSLLNGIRAAEGSIEIYGIAVNKQNSAKIKSFVGLIFQNPDDQLFCSSIFEDVSFGPFNLGLKKEEVIQKTREALSEVGLVGYDSRSSLHLSFGERKLAAIATVLSMSPKIIAMDEPTSNLDPKHRRKIINWVKNNTRTTLIISHDLDMLLETCQRILVLNSGRLIADDFVENVLMDKYLLEKNDLELPLSLQSLINHPEDNYKSSSIYSKKE